MSCKDLKIIADLHCHTVASDHAYSTITELAMQSKKMELAAFACTDHTPAIGDAPHIWHFHAMKNLIPNYIEDVRVLRGAEVNILDQNGEIDLPIDILERLDCVVASIHEPAVSAPLPWGRDGITSAYMGVIQNHYVDIIGHSGSTGLEYDLDVVIPAVRDAGKAVEVNENTFHSRPRSLENCREIVKACKKYGTPVVVSSDAHYHLAVGKFENSIAMLHEFDFPEELIVNSSIERLRKFFSRRAISI